MRKVIEKMAGKINERDRCTVCEGNNSCLSGCDHTPWGNKTVDQCGICGGDNACISDVVGLNKTESTTLIAAIAGGGGALLLVLIALVIFFVIRKRKSSYASSYSNNNHSESVSSIAMTDNTYSPMKHQNPATAYSSFVAPEHSTNIKPLFVFILKVLKENKRIKNCRLQMINMI